MKVSFIVVYSTRKSKNKFYSEDDKLDVLLTETTINLLSQLDKLEIDKEIILVDNTNNFPKEVTFDSMKVIEGIQSLVLKNENLKFKWFDRIPTTSQKVINGLNHAKACSLAFNQGLELATGDYIVMQHNDTHYLNKYYSTNELIKDTISYLEDNNLEYLTVDKKPQKDCSPKHVPYFADCYWFLCRRDFYDKHNIYVDWERGDTNHLATITCVDKGLKFEHLPGFYENKEIREEHDTNTFKRELGIKYPDLLDISHNIHTFNNIPFLLHIKGGTGLSRVKKIKHDTNYWR